ncbi:DinI-like family protein [Photobacterium nomapromontoriensis]|uniref:DinI-like family protein n=1 Tax=Photobacterium nomapromontoriensis TaxID=2910237 RepID=UPI003D0FBB8F
MRIELMLNKVSIPENGFPKIESEFIRRMEQHWPDAMIRVRTGTINDLTVLGGPKDCKAEVGAVLEEMFDEADEWLYNE